MNHKRVKSLDLHLQLAYNVVDETPAVVGYIDNDLYYRFANKAYLDWFGKTTTQVVGKHMLEVLGKIYYENFPYTMAALGGKFQTFERKFLLQDGTTRYGLVNYKPHFVLKKVMGFFVLVVDVTELKNAQLKLIAAHDRIEHLAKREVDTLHSSNKILARLCSMGQTLTSFLDFNSISSTFHSFINELLGPWDVDIYLLNSQGDLLIRVDKASGDDIEKLSVDNNGKSRLLFECLDLEEITILKKDQPSLNDTKEMSVTIAHPMLIGSVAFGVVTLHGYVHAEINQRFKLILKTLCGYAASAFRNCMAYGEVKRTQEMLVEQEKMQALSAIVGGVSHKINTPLGNCILSSSVIKDSNTKMILKLNDGSISKKNLESYLGNTETAIISLEAGLWQLAELIERFKNAIVLSAEERAVRFSFYECCKNSLKFLFVNTEFELDLFSPEDLEIISYQHSLENVLKALAINTIQHAFEGRLNGVVSISAFKNQDNTLEIFFKDNGVGISKCVLKSIFDPFFTTKMSSESGGLGLSRVYFLVTKVLHGEISVTSTVGHGTCFTIRIPANVKTV